MSLLVWFPLNSEIKNQGFLKMPSISSSAIVNTDELFGQCYEFVANDFLKITMNTPTKLLDTINSHSFSVCAWVKTTTNGCWLSITYSYRFYVKNIYVPSNSTSITNNVVTDGNWHHVCFTHNTDNLENTYYIDGEIVKKYTGTNKATTTYTNQTHIGHDVNHGTNASFYFTGIINDLRIYDNELGEYDVKRLSKRKIMDIMAINYSKNILYDNSGFLLNEFAQSGITFSKNSLNFNGTTSQIRTKKENNGLVMSGGTLSIWFTPLRQPTSSKLYEVLYVDSKSHMSIGLYYYSVTQKIYIISICGNDLKNAKMYLANDINFNSLNNVIAIYGTDSKTSMCLINGQLPEEYITSNGFNEPDVGLTIGNRQNNDQSHYKGSISKISVYTKAFTESEAKLLYEIGPLNNVLPEEYTRLKYIQSTGTQYIDTGINVKSNTTASFIYEFTNTSSTNYVFGQVAGSGSSILGYRSNRIWWFRNTDISILDTEKHNVDFNSDGKVYRDGTQLATKGTFGTEQSLTILLFAERNDNNAINKGQVKIYDFKLKENNLIILDLIPSKRKSDNVIGMYDLVSRQFFTNAGTGTFTEGPEF